MVHFRTYTRNSDGPVSFVTFYVTSLAGTVGFIDIVMQVKVAAELSLF